MKNHKRKYLKKKRAAQEAETRRRITEALVDLHGSLGPARTTVSEIADRAGVQRATVYRHFPDEASLFAACSAHWAERNPFPEPAAWAAIEDPKKRLEVGLSELYGFYARNENMLDNTTRDEPRVEALRPSMDAFREKLRAAVDALRQGRERKGETGRVLEAALGHALAFSTWRSLVRDGGLDREHAVALMAAMIEGSTGVVRAGARPDRRPPAPDDLEGP